TMTTREATSARSAIWRSMIAWPPTTSAPLSAPPRRRPRPPARIAAVHEMPGLDWSGCDGVPIIRERGLTLPENERTENWTARRRQPPSGHRGDAAPAPGVLRELAQTAGA